MNYPLFFLAATFVQIILQTNAQIPYSAFSGRDLEAVKRRFDTFLEAKARRASSEELYRICNPLRINILNYCKTTVGRPSDLETNSCDVYCCLLGKKTGNCQGIKGCRCLNKDVDIKCGLDGSFIGIRCPFDKSACWRKCCRKGRPGGRCRGFLKTKCSCY